MMEENGVKTDGAEKGTPAGRTHRGHNWAHVCVHSFRNSFLGTRVPDAGH